MPHQTKTTFVCKKFFLHTFNILEGQLACALHQHVLSADLRRKSQNSKRKTPESIIIAVKKHIQNFPTYTSHYIRWHNPGRKYLNPDLGYLEIYKEDNNQHLNEWVYRKNEFNLHLHHPRKDTCRRCDLLKLKVKACEEEREKRQLQLEHDVQ